MNPELMIFVGGILHFGILLASALVPKVLDWKGTLDRLDGLSRQIVWGHGVFIVLVIVGFDMISIVYPRELASGTPLARAACLFIAVFWTARLVVQFFVFDVTGYLKSAFLKGGYHSLTAVFMYHALVYPVVAFRGGW